MDATDFIKDLSQVSNVLALAGLIVAILGTLAAWWFFYVPRQIRVAAKAKLPVFSLDPAKLPFVVHVTNTNTRQFKIQKIGFETTGRKPGSWKSSSYELSLDAGLLKTDKLLITEGDSTEIFFDGYKVADDIVRGLRDFDLRLASTEFKIWLYITHGRRILVESEFELSTKIVDEIHGLPVRRFRSEEYTISKDPSELKEKKRYLKDAADEGYIPSMFEYGMETDDLIEKKRYLKKAADEGYVPAMFEYGMQADDLIEKKRYLKKAADEGDVVAMFEYAMEVSDLAEKKFYLKEAADNGYIPAKHEYARLLD